MNANLIFFLLIFKQSKYLLSWNHFHMFSGWASLPLKKKRNASVWREVHDDRAGLTSGNISLSTNFMQCFDKWGWATENDLEYVLGLAVFHIWHVGPYTEGYDNFVFNRSTTIKLK